MLNIISDARTRVRGAASLGSAQITSSTTFLSGGDKSNLERGLWSRAKDHIDAASPSSFRVLVLGFGADQLAAMRYHLRDIGASVVASASNVDQLSDIVSLQAAFTHIVINFDAFYDVDSGVEALLAFRERAGEVVIVLCSAAVSGDDLSNERACVCDATVRLPVSMPRLRDALVSGLSNNVERFAASAKAVSESAQEV